MEAIVLAGGMGTRLREVVPDLPKPMAPIAGRPFLEILLADLATKGVSRVVLSLGFKAETIRSHFGSTFRDMAIDYVVEPRPLGTGGGVRLAMEACRDDHCFVLNGDTFLDLEIPAVEQHWLLHRRPIMVGRRVADTARFGRLEIEGGRVVGMKEKGTVGPGLINAGCYVLNRGDLGDFALGQPFSLEVDFLAHRVQVADVDVFVTEGHFIDIGVPEDYARAQVELPLRSR